MSPKELFEAVSAKRIMVVAILFCSLVSPGFLALYHFKPQLVKDWELVRLLILSSSLTVPVVIGCVISVFIGEQRRLTDEKVFQEVWLGGAAIAAFVFHFVLFIAFSEPRMTFRGFVLCVCAFVFVVFLVCTGHLIVSRVKRKPPQRNAGSRPLSGDSPASETLSSLGPRGC